MRSFPSRLFVLIAGAGLTGAGRGAQPAAPPVIPLPAELTWNAGPSEINVKGAPAESLVPPGTAGVPDQPEGYALTIIGGGASIRSRTRAGLFYGEQTLAQLRRPDGRYPSVSIRDWPRFQWRGLEIDCGRHFEPKAEIEKMIDAMALQKLNVFHWHLTDDQGWRIEIKRYPRLTEIGAQGRYYTQDDIREVVAYAARRFVTVVPEIEMPGHSSAAIAAYPELGNDDVPDFKPKVQTTWGVFPYTYAPTPGTFQFLEGVLTEVMGLFPGNYIHVGGDEAPKGQWKASAAAQAYMRKHDLANEDELQSAFIRRIEGFIRAHGRRLIGWDEIQEGGLSSSATMMVWRDRNWALRATAQGNDVVMTPKTHCYFDYYQADPKRYPEPEAGRTILPLKKVYAFDPILAEMSADQAKHVLGVQGNLWSEHIANGPKLEYMAFPRACALAEVAWTSQARRDYGDFTRRLPAMLARLRERGIRFRPPTAEDLALDPF